jgi:hypothetical protein
MSVMALHAKVMSRAVIPFNAPTDSGAIMATVETCEIQK